MNINDRILQDHAAALAANAARVASTAIPLSDIMHQRLQAAGIVSHAMPPPPAASTAAAAASFFGKPQTESFATKIDQIAGASPFFDPLRPPPAATVAQASAAAADRTKLLAGLALGGAALVGLVVMLRRRS